MTSRRRLRVPRLKRRHPQTPVVMLDSPPPDRGSHDRLRVILLRQGSLPIVACLFIVAVIFTAFPDALTHTATSFEARSILHHVWHYLLLTGSGAAVVGTFMTDRRRGLFVEQLGLIGVECALVMNTIALVLTDSESSSGIGLALRVAAIIQIGIRIWILATRPTFELPAVAEPRGLPDLRVSGAFSVERDDNA
jgi:hypothetical protein